MSAKARYFVCVLGGCCACAAFAFLSAGCGGPSQSADQALNDRLRDANTSRTQIAKFSGTVTIDHAPPAFKPDESLMIMLYDTKNPPPPKQLPLSARVGSDGHFEFTSYTKGDGVAVGSYKVLFAAFKISPYRGGSTSPDALKNLYNDPDTSQFNVEITEPGKTDWAFDLEIAGKDAIAQPGERAITRIIKR
jgi:hypothetical protein